MKTMKIVIRAPNWVGDSVLSIPAIESVRDAFPNEQLWIAAKDWVKELFTLNGLAEGTISLPEREDLKTLKTNAQYLKGNRFDIGLLLTNSFGSALLFYLAGIPERWGYATDGRALLLTSRVRTDNRDAPRHHVHYYLDLLSKLGLETRPPALKLSVPPSEIAAAQERLVSQGLDLNRPIVVLSPGASYGPAKRWPASRFAQLAGAIQNQKGAEILVIGSAGEADIGAAIASGMNRKPAVLTGQTTLAQLLGLISQAALVVSNDTGPMHLANALRVPVVGIFGPTDPAVTGPLEQPSRAVKKDVPCWPCFYHQCPYDHRCMMTIEAADVLGAAEAIWK